MDKDLVQVYFSNSEVWIVGNRTWNGPYRVSGTPTILSLPIDPTLLGESILAHFSTLKTYSQSDENLKFFKHKKKSISWKQFATSYHLISVWHTKADFFIEPYEMNPDFSFSPSETRRLSLPQTCSAIELGEEILSFMNRLQ